MGCGEGGPDVRHEEPIQPGGVEPRPRNHGNLCLFAFSSDWQAPLLVCKDPYPAHESPGRLRNPGLPVKGPWLPATDHRAIYSEQGRAGLRFLGQAHGTSATELTGLILRDTGVAERE